MSAFDRLVILDFEATCQEDEPPSPQEIIELPSVLVSLQERRILDEHESFVRPIFHPTLSEFCTKLTSIRQEQVDHAPIFTDALEAHQAWLASHGLLDREDAFAFVTCGEWDLRSMLPRQCTTSRIPIPRVYRRWINVKTVFTRTTRKRAGSMPEMLSALGLELEGRHHRGIDDCRNIARIVLALEARGARFVITSKLKPAHMPPLRIVLHHAHRAEPVILKKRAMNSLLGLASTVFRTKIVRVETSDGIELTDDRALAELLPDAELRVS